MRKLTLALFLLLAPGWGSRPASASAQDENETETAPGTPSTSSSFRGPLASRNQMPLALLFAYLVPEDARSLERGVYDFEVTFDYSNIIMDQSNDFEAVRLDLEYARTDLRLRRGFGRGFELGASIRFYAYFGGFLDPFVSGFHDAFGLPNYLRGQTENGLVEYRYTRGEESLFEGTDSFTAVGDLSLHAKKTLVVDAGGRTALAARAVLKLPTGDVESLSGSGATDFGFGLAFDRKGERFGLYANANYHVLGEPEKLPAKNYFSLMVAADWHFKPRLAAVLQFDHARSPLEGDLRVFQNGAQQLALGLRFGQSERIRYEWRFIEDLSSFSPDFTFGFQMSVRFGGPSEARTEDGR